MDIGPEHSGTLFGIGNTAGSVAGMLAPVVNSCLLKKGDMKVHTQVMGAMTPDGTANEWRNLLYVTAAIMITGTAIFCIFARGEVQVMLYIYAKKRLSRVHL